MWYIIGIKYKYMEEFKTTRWDQERIIFLKRLEDFRSKSLTEKLAHLNDIIDMAISIDDLIEIFKTFPEDEILVSNPHNPEHSYEDYKCSSIIKILTEFKSDANKINKAPVFLGLSKKVSQIVESQK